ncbi:energy transducer TonB [Helicobacter winghamensis]|uniref:energy transducer TonB n=1 Tax=Helicobacter winghamensis TaxID=157268 RepID=UPI00279F4890
MKLLLNHKSQAFYCTSFLFALLFIGFLYSASWFRISPKQQNSFSLAMQQFITHSTQAPQNQTPNPKNSTQEISKEIPKESKNIPSKKHSQKQDPKPTPQHKKSPITPSNSSTQENIIPKNTIETLTFGKDNHPFLRAVKKAIDSNVNYPRQARKMRIQGEVIVEFLWTKHKFLKNLKVYKSSGQPILDKSALNAIQQAALHFPQHTNDVYLQIPIVFMLRN